MWSVVTWNLDGLGTHRTDERTEAAVFLAVTGRTLVQLGRGLAPVVRPPDVLLFQEVTAHTYRAHLRTHLPRAGYTLVPTVVPEQEEFEVVAVRAPTSIVRAEVVPLRRSSLGRAVTVVDVERPCAPPAAGADGAVERLRVLTAHFDSGADQGEVRVDAVRQVAGLMDGCSVFGGDANLRDDEWDDVAGDVPVGDAWEQTDEPWEVATTWRRGERRARFDRVWVGRELRATSMTAIGASAVNRTIGPPSDHLGLRVTLTANRPEPLPTTPTRRPRRRA